MPIINGVVMVLCKPNQDGKVLICETHDCDKWTCDWGFREAQVEYAKRVLKINISKFLDDNLVWEISERVDARSFTKELLAYLRKRTEKRR